MRTSANSHVNKINACYLRVIKHIWSLIKAHVAIWTVRSTIVLAWRTWRTDWSSLTANTTRRSKARARIKSRERDGKGEGYIDTYTHMYVNIRNVYIIYTCVCVYVYVFRGDARNNRSPPSQTIRHEGCRDTDRASVPVPWRMNGPRGFLIA